MNAELRNIVENSGIPKVSESEIISLLSTNPDGGGFISNQQFLESENDIFSKGFRRVISFGPFAEGMFYNSGPIINYAKEFKHLKFINWDSLLLKSNESDVKRVRQEIADMRYQLDEIDWTKNSDTRLANYLAINSLYTLVHLYNYSSEYRDIVFVLFLAKEPFTGFQKTNKYNPEIPISAFEIKIILELRRRGYRLPPVYMVSGLLENLENYNSNGIVTPCDVV